MATKQRQGQPKFSEGDEISLSGTVTIVHDEEYGRRRSPYDCRDMITPPSRMNKSTGR